MSATVKMDLRVDRNAKKLLEQAATRQGKSVAEFLIPDALKKAQRVLQREGPTRLSLRDWKRFLEILDDDSEPNAALKDALKSYKAAYGDAGL